MAWRACCIGRDAVRAGLRSERMRESPPSLERNDSGRGVARGGCRVVFQHVELDQRDLRIDRSRFQLYRVAQRGFRRVVLSDVHVVRTDVGMAGRENRIELQRLALERERLLHVPQRQEG